MATETSIEKRETQAIQPERLRAGRTYIPQVDIVEQNEQLLLLADMPGVKPEHVDITYERGELTILGRVEPRQGATQGSFLMHEYGIGDFYRVFRIGEGIDSSRISADVKDGVLTLRLPKTKEAVPRKITVKRA